MREQLGAGGGGSVGGRRHGAICFAGGLRMCEPRSGENGSVLEGPKIHPLGQRRWRPIKVPERVWWNPGQPPELLPNTEQLEESNPYLKHAIEIASRGARRSGNMRKGMLMLDWFEQRFAPDIRPQVAAVALLAWIWYSFPATSRGAVLALVPVQVSLLAATATLGALFVLAAALWAPLPRGDAVRRVLFLYLPTLTAFPVAVILAASGNGTFAIVMELVGTLMALGSLWYWKDLNKEFRFWFYRVAIMRLFVRWRVLLTALLAVGVALRTAVARSAHDITVNMYTRSLDALLAASPWLSTVVGGPGSLAIPGVLLAVTYLLYAAVFCTFVTDVGRYPFARSINTLLTLLLLEAGVIIIPEKPDPKYRLTDPRGGGPPEWIQKIGRPDRPGQRESMPEMEYPYLFQTLDRMEENGQFQGMYASSPSLEKEDDLLKTWAIYADIPDDESVDDSADIVNPAKVSEQRIQAILEEAADRMAGAKARRDGKPADASDGDSWDGDTSDVDDEGAERRENPAEDSVEWLFLDPNDRSSTRG